MLETTSPYMSLWQIKVEKWVTYSDKCGPEGYFKEKNVRSLACVIQGTANIKQSHSKMAPFPVSLRTSSKWYDLTGTGCSSAQNC